ncbi:MAG: YfhO family protein [Oscillospiraceae bacterium]
MNKDKYNYLKVFAIALVTATIIFLPFILIDKGLFLYYGDFDVQQIPFYRLAHDAIRDGNVLWNWNTDLGANFVGSYSFYLLGSPFFWLTIPFPSWLVPFLMGPLLILKFAFTAVTGFAYIKRFTQTQSIALVGGILYSFCGFNVYNIFFNHFNEVVMLFPLLLIALEEFVLNNRRGGFALAVAACAIVNYYFFFGQVIFVIIYFLFRCTAPEFKMSFKKFCFLTFEAVCGLGIAFVLLLPSVLAILGNPRTTEMLNGYDMIMYNNVQRYGLISSSFFFPPDIPARPNFFPNSESKWSSVSAFIPLISMSGVFAFFKSYKKHWAKRLIIVCMAMSFIPIFNAAFSAFNYNYYARWFYMFILIMVMVSCVALENPSADFKFGIKVTAIVVLAFSVIGLLPKNIDGEMKFFKLPPFADRFWIYIIIAILGLVITALLVHYSPRKKHFISATILSSCVMICFYSIFIIACGKEHRTSYEVVEGQALNGSQNINLPVSLDEQFYRIDTYNEFDNLGMYWKMPTINAFQSVIPPSIMRFYDTIGYDRNVGSRADLTYIGLRGLTSVRYSFCSANKGTQNVPVGFEYLDEQNGYKIYENQHFIPMGFTYDKYTDEKTVEKATNGDKDMLLLKAMMLKPEDIEKYGNLMTYFPYEDNETNVSYMNTYFSNDEYYTLCKKRAESAAYEFSYDNSGFTSKIKLEKENLVFFSVPFDKGWSATVNGKASDVIEVNGGFVAVRADAGDNEIRFSYETPGLKLGLIVSLGSLFALAVYMAFVLILRRRDPEQYAYDKFAHKNSIYLNKEIAAKHSYIKSLLSRKDDEQK